MFRFIALALVSTFGLLALMGAGMEGLPAPDDGRGSYGQANYQHSMQAGMMDHFLPSQETWLEPGATFVAGSAVPLHAEPRADAAVTAKLPPGVPIIVVKPAPEGFAYVRAESGDSGYVTAASLASSPD